MCICVVDLLCCTTKTNTTLKAMIRQQIIQDSKCDINNANGTLIELKKHHYFQKKGFLDQKFKEILTCFLVDNLSFGTLTSLLSDDKYVVEVVQDLLNMMSRLKILSLVFDSLIIVQLSVAL